MLTPTTSPSFDELDAYLQDQIDKNIVPCSILLLYKEGKIEFLQKYGWQDIENNIPIEFDSIFRIYSMTKPIITIGLMMLFEEGKFKLEDPISKFIPEFKDTKVFVKEEDEKIITEDLEREISILDLFTHTSGLSYGFFDEPIDKIYQEKINYENLKSSSLEEVIKIIAEIPLLFQPGKYFRYSYSTDVLGRLIEVLSGQPLDVFLQEKVFRPLEMNDTFFFVPEDKTNKFVKMYLSSPNKPLQLIETPGANERFSRNYKFLSGGGGLVSTLQDYFNFTLLFYDKGTFGNSKLLQPETIDVIIKNYLKDNQTIYDFAFTKDLVDLLGLKSHGQGLGIRVLIQGEDLGEHGWGGAAYTYYWIDPKNSVIGLFMTQVTGSEVGVRVIDYDEMIKLAYAGLDK